MALRAFIAMTVRRSNSVLSMKLPFASSHHRHHSVRSLCSFSFNKSVSYCGMTIPRRSNSTESTEEEPCVLHVDHATVLDGVRKRVITVLDVRRPDEIQELGLIPSANNIPVDEVETALKLSEKDFLRLYQFEKPEPDGPMIIVYCRSGKRAERACQIFQKFDYKNVANYVGSWNEWSEKHPEDVRVHPITDKQG